MLRIVLEVAMSKSTVSNAFIAGTCLLLFLLGTIVYWSHRLARASAELAATNELSRTHSQTIDGAFTVAQMGEKYYKLSVPDGASNIAIHGHFNATGGLANAIEVSVMSDDQFANRNNGNPPNAIYMSQKITGAAVNVALPSAGTYYVVFNNRFGLLAPKAVRDNLTLQYVK
jgi:hypothetical protein